MRRSGSLIRRLLALATWLAAPHPCCAQCHDDGPGLVAADTVAFNTPHTGYTQPFVAADTVLSALTLWSRWTYAPQVAFTMTDSSGTPVLGAGTVPMAGPFFAASLDTSFGPPYPVTYRFDPPIRFARGAEYSFVLGGIPATGAMLAASAPATTGANAWTYKFSDFYFVGVLGPSDIVIRYTLTYCDHAVPTRVATWGAVKTRYR